jgi:hypothetical protein
MERKSDFSGETLEVLALELGWFGEGTVVISLEVTILGLRIFCLAQFLVCLTK